MRSEIKRHRDPYVERIQYSLKVAERGEKKREERLEAVRAAREKLRKLKGTIEKYHDVLGG